MTSRYKMSPECAQSAKLAEKIKAIMDLVGRMLPEGIGLHATLHADGVHVELKGKWLDYSCTVPPDKIFSIVDRVKRVVREGAALGAALRGDEPESGIIVVDDAGFKHDEGN